MGRRWEETSESGKMHSEQKKLISLWPNCWKGLLSLNYLTNLTYTYNPSTQLRLVRRNTAAVCSHDGHCSLQPWRLLQSAAITVTAVCCHNSHCSLQPWRSLQSAAMTVTAVCCHDGHCSLQSWRSLQSAAMTAAAVCSHDGHCSLQPWRSLQSAAMTVTAPGKKSALFI